MTITPNTSLMDDPTVLTVELDGKKWPIPKLAPKQNEVVVPLVLELVPKLTNSVRIIQKEGEDASKARTSMDLGALGKALTEKGMKDLYTILFLSLQRGHKDLTREEFDDMPIGTLDAIEAVMVISRQTGVIRQAKAGEVPLAVGQAAA